jgi:hypothetical protein
VPALGAPQLLIRDHIEIIPNRKETVGEAQRWNGGNKKIEEQKINLQDRLKEN